MASQLNAAWRHKTASPEHLKKISARFLSDEPLPEKTSGGCQVIPFLLDDPAQSWIPNDLCKVLTQRGHTSRLFEPQTSQDSLDELETILQQQPNDSDICLFPTTSPTTIQNGHFKHAVLLVPASLDAVLTAYQRIKLWSQGDTPDIGIVMVGPRDQHAAWRYFRKLAVGSLRYLDIPLLNLGFLPQQVLPEQGPSDHHRHNFLQRISERLLRSGFHSPYRVKDPADTQTPA
jgi:hypothetical protein